MATRMERIQTAYVNRGIRQNIRSTVFRMLNSNEYNIGLINQKQIAKIVGCSEGQVSLIKKKMIENENFTEGDLIEQKRGRKNDVNKILDTMSYMLLIDALENHTPRDFDIDETSWTGPAIHKFLNTVLNINIDLKNVYYFLERNKITSKYAARLNPKKNAEFALYFATVIYPSICYIAIISGIHLYWLDQCHVQKGYHVRGYAPKGKRAVASHSTELLHSAYSFLTIIGIDGSCFMVTQKGYFTAETLEGHLNNFLKLHKGENIILFLDNHSIHWSYEFYGWLLNCSGKNKNGKIDVCYLPKYCPDMNPVEYLNNHIKNTLRRSGVETMDEMIAKAQDIVSRYNSNTPEIRDLVKSYFHGDGCKYTIEHYENINNEIEELKAAGEW